MTGGESIDATARSATTTVGRKEVPSVGGLCSSCGGGQIYREEGTRVCDGCGTWWSRLEHAPNNWRTNASEHDETDETGGLDAEGCPPLTEWADHESGTATERDGGQA